MNIDYNTSDKFTEHERWTKLKHLLKIVIAEYVLIMDHKIAFHETKILDHFNNSCERVILGAKKINKEKMWRKGN